MKAILGTNVGGRVTGLYAMAQLETMPDEAQYASRVSDIAYVERDDIILLIEPLSIFRAIVAMEHDRYGDLMGLMFVLQVADVGVGYVEVFSVRIGPKYMTLSIQGGADAVVYWDTKKVKLSLSPILNT